MSDEIKSKSSVEKGKEPKQPLSRRKFLAASAATVGGVAAIGFPMISRAQTITLRMQGAWSATDIINEFAMEFVHRVNKMSGGRLHVDYLTAGSVVKPFEVTDAVSKGVLDAGHTVPSYWYGKSKAASLFGSGPINGMDAHQTLSWIYRGGGLELYRELLQKLDLNYVGFFAMPYPTQPLGWFKEPITDAKQLKGLKYRTIGLAADLFEEMGAKVTQLPGGEIVPALERGVIEAFEFANPTSDSRFGAQKVLKTYELGSFHQAMEFEEIIINKKKWDALPEDLQAVWQYGVEAANSANYWTAMANYPKDLQTLIHKDKVNVVRTPKSIFKAQLEAWDKITKRLSDQDPFFKRVVESQRAWAKDLCYYSFLNDADFKMGYEHVFKAKLPV